MIGVAALSEIAEMQAAWMRSARRLDHAAQEVLAARRELLHAGVSVYHPWCKRLDESAVGLARDFQDVRHGVMGIQRAPWAYVL